MSVLDEPAVERDELYARVSERTREIVERRRRGFVKNRGWLVRRLLLAADLVGLLAALALAEWVVNRHNNLGVLGARDEVLAFVLSLPLWVVVAKLYGLYDRDEERIDHSTVDDVGGVFHMVTVCTFLFWVGSYVTRVAHPSPPKLFIFWAAAVAFVSISRAGARTLARTHAAYIQNTLIVGAGDVGQVIAKKLRQHPEYGINLLGFVDASSSGRERADLRAVDDPDAVCALVRSLAIDRVIVGFPEQTHEETLALVRELKELDVQVDVVPRLFELVSPGVGVHAVEGLPFMSLPSFYLPRSSALLKRSLDIAGATLGLLAFCPLFLLIAAAVKLESRGPVFFRQVRMGAGDRVFQILKFRTMVLDAEERKAEIAHLNKHAVDGGDPRMFKVERDPRATRAGRILRRYSVDELPQLWNVLRGEMSLVGPRPLILAEHAHVRDWAKKRTSLRPGITGLWQVLGRDDIPFEDMVRLDYLYVASWSLGRDLRILGRTPSAVLRRPLVSLCLRRSTDRAG